MLELKFLGRGSAFNTKEGNNSAYIKDNDKILFIDCGESTFKTIKDKNLLEDIKEVYITTTHTHSDHIGSLSSLILYLYYVKHIIPVIIIPNTDMEQLIDMMGASNCCKIENCVFVDNYIIKSMNLELGFVPVDHCDELVSFSILISKNDKDITYYSGDAKEIDPDILISFLDDNDEIEYLYQDTCLADYEGNVHLPLRELCELIPKENRNKVYCMHLDCDELIDKAKAEGFNVVEIE